MEISAADFNQAPENLSFELHYLLNLGKYARNIRPLNPVKELNVGISSRRRRKIHISKLQHQRFRPEI